MIRIQIRDNDRGLKTSWECEVPACDGVHSARWDVGSGWSSNFDHAECRVWVRVGKEPMFQHIGEFEDTQDEDHWRWPDWSETPWGVFVN